MSEATIDPALIGIGGTVGAPMPAVVDRETWQKHLDELLVREKALTREGDAIAAARRRLPMVEVDATTTVVGRDGPVSLLDVFDTCTRVTQPTQPSARGRTQRVPATTTSWAGRCRGTRQRTPRKCWSPGEGDLG